MSYVPRSSVPRRCRNSISRHGLRPDVGTGGTNLRRCAASKVVGTRETSSRLKDSATKLAGDTPATISPDDSVIVWGSL